MSDTQGRTLGAWLEALASDAPTPGGGPAAALVGSIGASLIAMVGRLTVGRDRFADVEERMRAIVDRADGERARFLGLADLDEEAFEGYMAAFRLPRDTEEQRATRGEALATAALAAADVPMEVARRAVDLMELAVEAAAMGNPHAASDGACAAACLHAAAHAALASVRINVGSMADPEDRARYAGQADDLQRRAAELLDEADGAFAQRLSS